MKHGPVTEKLREIQRFHMEAIKIVVDDQWEFNINKMLNYSISLNALE